MPESVVERIWAAIDDDPATEITVDVERLVVEVPAIGLTEPFPMDPATQDRFLRGLDDVGITLTHADAITTYEHAPPRLDWRRPEFASGPVRPWWCRGLLRRCRWRRSWSSRRGRRRR